MADNTTPGKSKTLRKVMGEMAEGLSSAQLLIRYLHFHLLVLRINTDAGVDLGRPGF